MAINYTISYTFTPGTTISSSQVNTNFSDNANTWTGLEALAKSFSALRVDATPTTSTDVAIKSYVDKLNAYRRPVLQYNSTTVVNIETGIDGTSGDCTIVFPDGTKRTDTVTGRIQCNLAQVAALSGSWQSGLRTGSVATNTWYAIYAVKTTDDTAKFVAVADTVTPIQSNYATLNSNFGSNGWVYLGLIRYGDQAAINNVILKFVQAGNTTVFYNTFTDTNVSSVLCYGIDYGTTAGATSLTLNWVAGMSGAAFPENITLCTFGIGIASQSAAIVAQDNAQAGWLATLAGSASSKFNIYSNLRDPRQGIRILMAGSTAMFFCMGSFVDGVLGIGANPVI